MLDQLKPREGSIKDNKRVGRGIGSGNGKTAGRGYKGQRSRSGGKGGRRGFEGGQMPLQRRLPKRGFFNKFAVPTEHVTTQQLNRFEDGAEISLEALQEAGLVSRITKRVRLIANGSLEKKLNIKVFRVSKSAREAVEAKGGQVEVNG